MPWTENGRFPRGSTFKGGTTIDTVNDPTPQENLEGKLFHFNDDYYGSGVPILCRCVRNGSTGLVYPARLYQYDPAYIRRRVNAQSTVANQAAAPADEFLSANGVPVNDLFYLILSGPALVYTGATAGAANVINQGDQLVATTAATSGAPDAGSVSVGNTVGNTAYSNNYIGRAMSASTTGNTNTGLLCMVALESRA